MYTSVEVYRATCHVHLWKVAASAHAAQIVIIARHRAYPPHVYPDILNVHYKIAADLCVFHKARSKRIAVRVAWYVGIDPLPDRLNVFDMLYASA